MSNRHLKAPPNDLGTEETRDANDARGSDDTYAPPDVLAVPTRARLNRIPSRRCAFGHDIFYFALYVSAPHVVSPRWSDSMGRHVLLEALDSDFSVAVGGIGINGARRGSICECSQTHLQAVMLTHCLLLPS